jgi:methylthioribose-1-phosphate isomerase
MTAPEQNEIVSPLEWRGDHLRIIDQTYLPKRTVYIDLRDVGRTWEAIRKMRVRGAPAIGITAAYGFYLGLKEATENSYASFKVEVDRVEEYLKGARPTAVNLAWALNRVKNTIHANKEKPIAHLKEIALQTAITIHDEDRRVCKQIGLNGLPLVKKGARVLTHCNTGSLATAQYGTALSVIYHAFEKDPTVHVWVDETRPLLQGARLTAWELDKAGVPQTLITDSMAGFLMKLGKVDMVIVGADRIAANGDTANKIGTYSLSILAKEHGIPFYVAAPVSTFDGATADGNAIVIEERDPKEVTVIGDVPITAGKINAWNPAFDVTPASNITAFITERGLLKAPYPEAITALLKK